MICPDSQLSPFLEELGLAWCGAAGFAGRCKGKAGLLHPTFLANFNQLAWAAQDRRPGEVRSWYISLSLLKTLVQVSWDTSKTRMGFSAWILRVVYLHNEVLLVFCSISSFFPKDVPALRCQGSGDCWQSCVRKMWWHGWTLGLAMAGAIPQTPTPQPWLASVLTQGFCVQWWCQPPSRRAVPAQHTLPSLLGPSGANHRGPPRQRTTLTPNLIAVSLFWGKEGNCSPSGRADLPWGGPEDIGWTGKGREADLKVLTTGQRMTRNYSLRR